MATRRGSRTITYHAPDSKAGAELEGSISGALAAFSEMVQQQALRSAARAGALVIYNEMRLRAAGADGGPNVGTGRLVRSIFHWHDDKASINGKQVYLIGPNKRTAPHWFNVEYGHFRVNVVIRLPNGQFKATPQRLQKAEFVPPYSYIRTTWDAKKSQVAPAMLRRLAERIDELRSEVASVS